MTAKKMTVLLLAVCLILVMPACGRTGSQEVPEEEPSGVQPEKVPEIDWDKEPDAVFKPDPDLFLNSVPSEKCPTLTELADPFGGLGAFPEIYSLDGNILAVSETSLDEETRILSLKLVSSETGLMLSEAEIKCWNHSSVFAAEKHILIADPYFKTATVFDAGLDCMEYQLTGEDLDMMTFFMDKDARYLYSTEYWCENITVTELETGEERNITPDMADIVLCHTDCESTLIKEKDPETGESRYYSLDMAAAEFTQLPYEGNYVLEGSAGDLRLALVSSAQNTYRIDSGDGAFIFSEEADSAFLCAGNGLIVLRSSKWYDEENVGRTVLSAYRKDGTFVSTCSFELSDISAEPVYCPRYNGFFLLTRKYYQDTYTLQFWDCSVPAEGTDLELHPLSEFLPEPGSGDAVAAVLYERAEKLGERYGFELLIADRAGREFDSFSAEPAMDYWSIDFGLCKLEEALSNYPEGFLRLLAYDNIRGIRIHFTGTITPGSDEYGDGFGPWQAFVQYSGEYRTMVVDLSYWNLKNTFCHEFSHMIDTKLGYDSLIRGDALYSDEAWDALNPPDFEYSYSYAGDGSYDDLYDDYFVDGYSRTYPTEDRARIMEFAINEPSRFCEAEGLLAKLDYYSRCIRDALDPGDWPEVLSWEKPLYDYGYRQAGQ